jgi:ribosome-associated translation inhibitor RaiA
MSDNKSTKGEVIETKEALNEEVEKRLERLENELIQEIKQKIATLKKELAYSDLTVVEGVSTSREKSIFDTIKVSKGVVILGFADKKMTVETLVIPEKIGGDKVISIEDNAFASTSCIKRVELPTCLEAIGERAFYNCKGLKHVLYLKAFCK